MLMSGIFFGITNHLVIAVHIVLGLQMEKVAW